MKLTLRSFLYFYWSDSDSKVHVAHMGPTWVLLAPGRPHVPCYQGISVYQVELMLKTPNNLMMINHQAIFLTWDIIDYYICPLTIMS